MDIFSILAGFLGTIITIIVSIISLPSFKNAIGIRLINGIRGKVVVTIDDLQNHELFSKLDTIAYNNNHIAITEIEDSSRAELFLNYMLLLCQSFSNLKLLVKDGLADLNENELKKFILTYNVMRADKFKSDLTTYLVSVNSDRNQVNAVVAKLAKWYVNELKVIDDNIYNVIISGRFTSAEYKLDVIFSLYALGIDFLIINGAKSFNKLNGDLSGFLITNK